MGGGLLRGIVVCLLERGRVVDRFDEVVVGGGVVSRATLI